MKKLNKLLSLVGIAFTWCLAITSGAMAVCPVCTIAIGGGLEGARLLGVDDVITGIWAGGLTVSLIGWTANYMKKRGVKNKIWYVMNVLIYVALLACVYFVPTNEPFVKWFGDCMWGIDRFLLGTIVGAVTFILMELWYANIKKNNGGHAQFPFQKVVMPFGGLLVITLIFWAIIEWLPDFGVVLC